MPEAHTHDVTQLLIDWSNGDKSALDKLVPIVDQELRRLAHHYMQGEPKTSWQIRHNQPQD